MPTHPAKARKLLKQGNARVIQLKPFTIKLNYKTSEYTQDTTLGIDSGYLNIGFSVVSEQKEYITGEVKLAQGIRENLMKRSTYRRSRRGRLRYRKPRYDNRKVKKGWLAPSIQHKLDSHIRFIKKLKEILPIKNTIIEVANFDIQKIKKPDIAGEVYQKGEQMNFWNVREYVFHRDNHKCQNPDCKNKSENPILQLHHIVFRGNGGTDVPSNLITLCTKCHTPANHKKGNFLYNWQTNKPKIKSYKESTFMSMVRWRLSDMEDAKVTFGYITKAKRINLGIEKTNYNDAFVIAGGSEKQNRCEPIEYRQIRRNNRSLEKFYDAKFVDIRTGKKASGSDLNGGRRTRNKDENDKNMRIFRGEKLSKGQRRIRKQRYFYQPNDLVKFNNQICRVIGTLSKGKSVKLDIGKTPNPKLLTHYRFSKGLRVV